MRTLDAAQGRWRQILTAFGIDQASLRNHHSVCPICTKKKFRFDDQDGKGTWICNTCGAGYGFKLLKLFTQADDKQLLTQIDAIIGVSPTYSKPAAKPDADRQRDKLKQFGRSLRECGTITAAYLRNRGVGLSQMSYMREHPSAPYYHEGKLLGFYPAMVNGLRDVKGQVVTFHVTYLNQDGSKADVPVGKKIMTPSQTITGSAIRLSQLHAEMAITEGIETALGVMTYEKVPCWAAYSANNLAKFDPPEGIKSLIIYGDRDFSFTGQAAAYELARRMQAKGIGVEVALPPDEGQDWLDYWGETQPFKEEKTA